MEEKTEKTRKTICPLLSIGKDTPTTCNPDCQWYYSERKDCAVWEIVEELYGIKLRIG